MVALNLKVFPRHDWKLLEGLEQRKQGQHGAVGTAVNRETSGLSTLTLSYVPGDTTQRKE